MLEFVGPGSYDPNPNAIHKNLPSLTIPGGKSAGATHGPKKVLENYIANIFVPKGRSETEIKED